MVPFAELVESEEGLGMPLIFFLPWILLNS
jgi:hypothetical protein